MPKAEQSLIYVNQGNGAIVDIRGQHRILTPSHVAWAQSALPPPYPETTKDAYISFPDLQGALYSCNFTQLGEGDFAISSEDQPDETVAKLIAAHQALELARGVRWNSAVSVIGAMFTQLFQPRESFDIPATAVMLGPYKVQVETLPENALGPGTSGSLVMNKSDKLAAIIYGGEREEPQIAYGMFPYGVLRLFGLL